MNQLSADILAIAWRKLDLKLVIDGDMHVLRWRRCWFVDEVFFDDRRVATAEGLFGRDTIFGLGVVPENKQEIRLLLTIDPEIDWNDWSGAMCVSGVRLETADQTLIAHGSLGPDQMEPFRQLYDGAIKAVGLS